MPILRTLLALFDRHAAIHLDVEGDGFPLTDSRGQLLGAVDRVRLQGSRLRVSGWARAARVTLQGGGNKASTRPRLLRTDVERVLGLDPRVGFDLEMGRPVLPPHHGMALILDPGGSGSADPLVYLLPLPHAGPARLWLWPGFLWRLLLVAPDALRWRLSRDARHRARVKRLLGLDAAPQGGLVDAGALAPPAPRGNDRAGPAPVTIVLPVYNAFDLLPEALGRVAAHTDLPWRLIVVEDASPDPRVRPWLRDWAAGQGAAVEVIENARNLGFIGSVNAGLARATALGGHVVLLNSDALVPPGWASRLLAPILADPAVASVTPLSNDAEIFSVPAICARLPLAPGQADAIDAAARTLDPLAASAPAPTGVGFCMAVARPWLARVPALDTAFGRGYGEEVDWCQRVRGLGGRHLGTGALFVEHRGGESFGAEAKRELVARNNAIVARRYPAYDGEVQAFIADDPLLAPRLLLAVAWAGAWSDQRAMADGPGTSEAEALVPIYLAHSLGGGADLYLARRMAEDLAATGRPSVVLRVGGLARWQVELWGPNGATLGRTEDLAVVERLLAPLTRRRVVYSCAVGHAEPTEIPGILLGLRADAVAGRVEVLVHDFFPVSPSYTLLDARNEFRGPVAPGLPAAADPAHATTLSDGTPIDLARWQDAWRPLLAAADEVTTFSRSSRDLVLAAHPMARVEVRPHRLLAPVPRLPPPAPEAPRVLGVLGNIGAQKGAALLRDLAPLIPSGGARPIAALVVVGNVDPAYAPPSHVAVHGDYALEDLPGIVARHGITDWLIPSIWPETFSFTTHEALASGLPVHAFDIGAQGEAVAGAPNGRLLPYGSASRDAHALLRLLVDEMPAAAARKGATA